MSNTPTQNDQRAWELLNQIYDHWTQVSFEGDQEFRSPKNRYQIWYSKRLLRKVREIEIYDDEVKSRFAETEEVVDSAETALPRYGWKIVKSLAISLFTLSLFLYAQYHNTSKIPDFTYDTEWFTMNKGGYLTSVCFVANEKVAALEDKIYLKKGTQLTPMGQMGTEWIQAKTPDGQVGFINYKDLNGNVYVEADDDALIFDKIDSRDKRPIAEGTRAEVLARKIIRKGSLDYEYVKLRFNGDSIAWATVYDFHCLMFDQIPYINQGFRIHTSIESVEQHLINHHIDSIQAYYGPATSLFQTKQRKQAYYKGMVVVDNKIHYREINILLDETGIATEIKYLNDGKTRFFDHFPLLSTMWNSRLNINDAPMYSNPNSINYFLWWDNFKSLNWITRIIGWIVKLIMMIVVVVLVFCIPRGLISPIMNFFAMTRFLTNGLVILINTILFAAISYLFFIYATIYIDQWLIPAIGTIVLFFFWEKKHTSNIAYNRCPSCNTLYSALDAGTTFKGRSKNVSWGTYDEYMGTSTEYESNKRIDTKNYERRSKKTTEITENFLDHRTCSRCGYQWDVEREEVDKNTDYL